MNEKQEFERYEDLEREAGPDDWDDADELAFQECIPFGEFPPYLLKIEPPF